MKKFKDLREELTSYQEIMKNYGKAKEQHQNQTGRKIEGGLSKRQQEVMNTAKKMASDLKAKNDPKWREKTNIEIEKYKRNQSGNNPDVTDEFQSSRESKTKKKI